MSKKIDTITDVDSDGVFYTEPVIDAPDFTSRQLLQRIDVVLAEPAETNDATPNPVHE